MALLEPEHEVPPDLLAPRDLGRILELAEILNPLVVAAEHAERVLGVGSLGRQAQNLDVVSDFVDRLAPLAVAAEDAAELLESVRRPALAEAAQDLGQAAAG